MLDSIVVHAGDQRTSNATGDRNWTLAPPDVANASSLHVLVVATPTGRAARSTYTARAPSPGHVEGWGAPSCAATAPPRRPPETALRCVEPSPPTGSTRRARARTRRTAPPRAADGDDYAELTRPQGRPRGARSRRPSEASADARAGVDNPSGTARARRRDRAAIFFDAEGTGARRSLCARRPRPVTAAAGGRSAAAPAAERRLRGDRGVEAVWTPSARPMVARSSRRRALAARQRTAALAPPGRGGDGAHRPAASDAPAEPTRCAVPRAEAPPRRAAAWRPPAGASPRAAAPRAAERRLPRRGRRSP